ncbi:MAG TPA: hypothetical protein VNS55_00815 [Nocardioides sp.]|nr:hypothetical protein [Nocardioides sp.]
MSNTRKLRQTPSPRTLRPRGVPRCDCDHGSGPGLRPCGRPAYVRVTVVCRAAGCDDVAASYVLCGACLDQWLERAASDSAFPEFRIAVL